MSGIVDMCSSELAKLKEKGQAFWSSGSVPASQETAQQKTQWWNTGGSARAVLAKKLPSLELSDGAVSMLVDSMSA